MSQFSLELVPYPFLVFGHDSQLQGFNGQAKDMLAEQGHCLILDDSAARIFDLQGHSLAQLAKTARLKGLKLACANALCDATLHSTGHEEKLQYSITLQAISKTSSPKDSDPSPSINSLNDILVKLEDARNPSPPTMRTKIDEMPHSIFTSSHTGELSFINKQFFEYTGLCVLVAGSLRYVLRAR